MSTFQQFSNNQASLTAAYIKQFLSFCGKKTKISDILSNFDENFDSFNNSNTELVFDIDNVTNFDVSIKKQKNKKSNSSLSFEHEEGKCCYKFNKGENKNMFCNKKTNDSEFCSQHKPKHHEQKQYDIVCDFVSKDGKTCAKEGKTEFNEKMYCGFHLNTVKKQFAKAEREASGNTKVRLTGKNSKTNIVEEDDSDIDAE